MGLSLMCWREFFEEILSIKESTSSADNTLVALLHCPSDLEDLGREELREADEGNGGGFGEG